MGWQRWQTRSTEARFARIDPTPPVRDLPPAPVPAPAPASEPPAASDPSAQPIPSAPVSTVPPVSEAAESPGPPPDSQRNASIEVNVPNGEAGMAVQVVASERTWVSITVNGRSVFSGTL
jgi:hypothetical protein